MVGTRGSEADVLWMSVVRVLRGVGGVWVWLRAVWVERIEFGLY